MKTGKTMIERAKNFVISRGRKLTGRVPAYSVSKGWRRCAGRFWVGRAVGSIWTKSKAATPRVSVQIPV